MTIDHPPRANADRVESAVAALQAVDPDALDRIAVDQEIARMASIVSAARRAGVPDYELARAICDFEPVLADPDGVDRLVDAAGPAPLAFRTIAELREIANARPLRWVVHGLLGCGAVTLLGAKPKVGKTTFLAALLAACERGVEVAGFETTRTTAVYCSEEPASLLVERCDKFHVEGAVFLCREEFSATASFGDFIAAGVRECLSRDALVLVVDTYARFARMAADAEKDAGATQAVMEAVLAAAAQGIAVVLVTHMRKGDGEEGESFRGSTALTGAADILLELRRASDDLREITCYSRFAESPTEPLLMRLEGETYVREEGEASTRGVESAKTKILMVLRSNGPLARKDLWERVPMRNQDRHVALADLLTAGSVVKTGSGKRGDPHLFAFRVPGGSELVPGNQNGRAVGGSPGGLPPSGVPPGTTTDLGDLSSIPAPGGREQESDPVETF